jgi:hypothetical protein
MQMISKLETSHPSIAKMSARDINPRLTYWLDGVWSCGTAGEGQASMEGLFASAFQLQPNARRSTSAKVPDHWSSHAQTCAVFHTAAKSTVKIVRLGRRSLCNLTAYLPELWFLCPPHNRIFLSCCAPRPIEAPHHAKHQGRDS